MKILAIKHESFLLATSSRLSFGQISCNSPLTFGYIPLEKETSVLAILST
ncbi:MAG: hypothetical protein ACTS85_01580 [Arsenophonus sp. NC-PG7-MAG3]